MLNAKRRKIIKKNAEMLASTKPQEVGLKTSLAEKGGLKKWLANNWYIILGLVVLAVIVYANGLNGAFVSDDINWIPKNLEVGSFRRLFTKLDRPAVWFIYFIAHSVGGLNPFFYRLPNLLIHVGSVIAAFGLLNILTNKKTAIFASLIFAVHPILIESVTWIAGGSHAGYALFFLLSFITYLISENSKKLYFLSIAFFIVSLAFSEKAVSLILVYPLYEIAFGSLKQNWKRTLPFLLIGVYILIPFSTKVEVRVTGLETYNYLEPGTDNPLLQIPISITEYLRLMFWPSNLTLYHSELSFSWFQYLTRVAILISLLAAIGISYWKKRQVFFWLLFFIIALLPTLTPYRIGSVVAERYVYLGSLGIFTLVGMGLSALSDREKLKEGVYLIFPILILALSVRTIVRNHDWLSEDNLWIASAKTSPSSPNVHLNLGDMYARHKDYQKAIESLNRAIELKPSYADAYHNMANSQIALFMQEKDEEYLKQAVDNYLLAIKYNPLLWQSYQNLGSVYFNVKQYDEAISLLKKAVEINPSNLNLQYNLGIVYLNSGNPLKAREIFLSILEHDPGNQTILELLKQTE